MPVAVDPTRAMLASDVSTGPLKHAQDVPLLTSPKTPLPPRKRKKTKGKEVEEVEDEAWTWKSLTESSASRAPPLFTKDASYFFSAVGPSVKIHSVATGEVISTLTPPTSDVAGGSGSAVQADCGTSSTRCSCRPLTFRSPFSTSLRTRSTATMFSSPRRGPARRKRAKVPGVDTAEDNVAVLRISLRPKRATAGLPVQISSEISAVGKTRSTSGLAVSPSGAWLVATGGHKAYVCSTSNLKAGFTKFVSPERLTCLAFHPSEEYFATGDATGCIRLWYCLNDSATVKAPGVEKTAQTTTLHWHSHTVSSIAFTANGAYLLSGGEEAVFVIWQLHTGKKEYIPRVGAPITHVALAKAGLEEEEYLLALADASYVFIRAGTLRISRSIARIKLDPAIAHDRPSTSTAVPLAVHSLTSTLILPSSHPSSLQTFAPSTSKLVLELEVSPSNRVSRRDDKVLEPSRVERAVVSDSGEWMATIDAREADESFRGEVYMKIWWWDRKAGFWILNTRVDRPHGLKKVTGVVFTPTVRSKDQLLLVTTGEDGNIKSWRIRSTTTKTGEVEDFWVARSTFRFRTELPSDVSWSPDGSLLAVSLGPHVALYDPLTNVLCQTLTCSDCSNTRSVQFIGLSGRYLAVAGHRDVLLWDLVTQSLRWHYKSPVVIDRIVSHPREEIFGVFECPPSTTSGRPSTRVLLFQPSSSSPSASRTVPFRLRSIVPHSSLGTNSDPSAFTLVGVTDQWSVVVFGDDIQLPEAAGEQAQGIIQNEGVGKRTLFQDMFGASAFADLQSAPATTSAAASNAQPWKGKEAAGVFNAPAYLMPPLESLFDSVMDGFLAERPTANAVAVSAAQEARHDRADDDMDVDFDMDADEPTAPVTAAPIERVVDKQEMRGFVDLFIQHAVKAPSSHQQASVPPIYMNGIHKPNGAPPSRMNGHPTHLKTPAKPNGISSKNHPATPSEALPGDESSPAVKVGKKRKKSLG
nr:WD40 repeat-like protein [Mycoleptodonoides aitchisonii]